MNKGAFNRGLAKEISVLAHTTVDFCEYGSYYRTTKFFLHSHVNTILRWVQFEASYWSSSIPQPVLPQQSSFPAFDTPFSSTPPSPTAVTLDVDCDTEEDGLSDSNLEDELGFSKPENEGLRLELDFGGQEINHVKQCGAINAKGLPCTRSLTCKSHSMGIKHTVEGRSRPYDELLLDWHRKNIPDFVELVTKDSEAGSGSQRRMFTNSPVGRRSVGEKHGLSSPSGDHEAELDG
ncbi:SAGA complex subunit Sgf73 [Marasmius crinis-equi]|uniref:SAGA complex subunit Sgf73 n=1 Tax=Marasmius crinis-equi TaxID=585013 RepID=A0ABR3F2R4_9AGAR